MKKNKTAWRDRVILGFLASICLAEGIHLAALVMKWNFHTCALLLGVAFLAAAAAAILLWALQRKKSGIGAGETAKENQVKGNLIKGKPLCLALFLGLILFQIIWNYYMHQPYTKGDITVETVQTILATDTVYQVNPMTGEFFEAGMPSRLKILVLPVLYAAVCQWTGMPAQTVVYEWIPTLILLLSYLVYSLYARHFFPHDGEKQCLFLLFVAVLYQFGTCSLYADGFRALQSGFTGESIRALVILPYVLLSCIERKWWNAAAGALAEVCLVWTLYGLGSSVAVIGCMLVLQSVMTLREKKKRGGAPT